MQAQMQLKALTSLGVYATTLITQLCLTSSCKNQAMMELTTIRCTVLFERCSYMWCTPRKSS